MTPPCRVFPASQLPTEIQVNDGKRRKGGKIDLSACELLSMVQYDCQVDNPDRNDSPVRCWPVQRWFRRYVVSYLGLPVHLLLVVMGPIDPNSAQNRIGARNGDRSVLI